MRAGIARVVLAATLTAASLPGTAADTIIVVGFDDTKGIDLLLGVDHSATPGINVGYDGFYWAWNGAGDVTPGKPATVGFLLGDHGNPDFAYVGGTEPQFAYLGARVADGYVSTIERPFQFLGAVFSSQTPGTLVIVGQARSAKGGGVFEDVPGVALKVAFDDQTQVVEFKATEFPDIDRLVISSADNANGKAFQWALDDFRIGYAAAVPEPATWALFGLGVLAVGFSLKRHNLRIR